MAGVVADYAAVEGNVTLPSAVGPRNTRVIGPFFVPERAALDELGIISLNINFAKENASLSVSVNDERIESFSVGDDSGPGQFKRVIQFHIPGRVLKKGSGNTIKYELVEGRGRLGIADTVVWFQRTT